MSSGPDDPQAQRPRLLERELLARAGSVRDARAVTRDACRSWRLGSVVCEALVLVVSELVTNVVRAGGDRVLLRLVLGRRQVRVEVVDEAPGVPRVRRPGAAAESGRGLWLVSAVSTRWGVEQTSTGKVVWAEFGL